MKKKFFLLKLFVSLALVLFLYWKIDFKAAWTNLMNVRAMWVAFAFVLLAANTALGSLKWKLLLAADGIEQPFWRLFASHLSASFFNLFMPSTVGGDVYRIADIGSRAARASNVAASVLVDRLTGFVALVVYGLVSPFVARAYIPNWTNRFLILPMLMLAALIAVFLVLFEGGLLRRLAKPFPRAAGIVEKILSSVDAYRRRLSALLGCLAIGFVFQGFAIVAIYALSEALGLGIPLLPFCFFVPFITLFEMIPVSIFGIGLRDTGYVWFMKAVEHTEADAASFSLLYVTVSIAYVLIGGVIFLFRKANNGTTETSTLG